MYFRKKVMYAITLVSIMVICFTTGHVLAYVTTTPYKLSGGIANRTFYIGDPSGTWKSDIRAGVSAWNLSSTTANFFERFNNVQTVDYFVGEFGNVEWCGYTYYLNSSGSYINYGGYPNANWYRNEIKIDYPGATGCPVYNKKATAAHELGHAMGLKHSNVSGVLMSVPTGADTPKTDDVNGINYLY